MTEDTGERNRRELWTYRQEQTVRQHEHLVDEVTGIVQQLRRWEYFIAAGFLAHVSVLSWLTFLVWAAKQCR